MRGAWLAYVGTICIIRNSMAYAAIVGASGYSGQETLDRVLAHPELELVALGSDSLAGQPATALDPRLARNGAGSAPAFVTNEEALSSGADVFFVCLGHEEAASSTFRRAAVVDLSGAHRLRDADLYPGWYGFAHPARERARKLVLLASGALPSERAADREPGLLRDRRDPRAPAPRRRSSNLRERRRRREVGRLRRRARAEGELARGLRARERLRLQVGRHQHEPEIAQALGFPVCFVPHLLPVRRGLIATCYVRGPSRRRCASGSSRPRTRRP